MFEGFALTGVNDLRCLCFFLLKRRANHEMSSDRLGATSKTDR